MEIKATLAERFLLAIVFDEFLASEDALEEDVDIASTGELNDE